MTILNVSSPTDRTVDAFKQAWADNMAYRQGASVQTASVFDAYASLAYTVRDYLVDRYRRTVNAIYAANPKFVYYLSAEYLPGRQLKQNMLYTDTLDLARAALADFGYSMNDILAVDPEPGLGNGGLGRLASCFLDSLATLDIPCVGYGIRYEYGIFEQTFKDGWQDEVPDEWLLYGNPWEFPQPDDLVEVGFGGYTENVSNGKGGFRVVWRPDQRVRGEPYYMLVPGYGTDTVNILRLWRARASKEFDFRLFDEGDYARAVEQKIYTENITKVLYPNDNTPQGRELRLRQQYFFVACSLRDIIRRFRIRNTDWAVFPDKVVIQLNDTHPTIAIPELMRILLDEECLAWDKAWAITSRVFANTCHTLLPEALEKWPITLLSRLLPRHVEIITEIDRRLREEVRRRFPDEPDRPARMSLFEGDIQPLIRMAYLATVGSFSVNGVAALHSRLLADYTLADFSAMWPDKFNNKTNGVTPRRFVRLANPRLARLITDTLGGADWLRDLDRLSGLEAHADDPAFRRAWRAIKQQNKQDLAALIEAEVGVHINPDSMFDVMVKRLHEYKRQLLKALHIITLYHRLKTNPTAAVLPRTFIFGAKAAPGYYMAKLIIKLINAVADVVNTDPIVSKWLKVVFLPNFNVSLGEVIYPAADLSEQISLAGKEASGTGNMKFALNGAITIGTLDGANIEIRERVGADNFFLFGLTAEEVMAWQARGYRPADQVARQPELRAALDLIASGAFGGDRGMFRSIVDNLVQHDTFMLLADYPAYIEAQDRVEVAYRDTDRWTRMSILNTARCGFFSSDRTIRQYAEDIWQVQPARIP